MKLTFKMTADEFYRGFNYKTKKLGMSETAEIISLVIILIASIVSTALGVVKAAVILPFAAILCLFFIIKQFMTKNSITNDFQHSPILNDENTIKLYDDGMELFSSFEKIYTPWQSVYAVKETKSELIILPTLSRGVAVISKQRYGKELDEIIKVLKSKGVMK